MDNYSEISIYDGFHQSLNLLFLHIKNGNTIDTKKIIISEVNYEQNNIYSH